MSKTTDKIQTIMIKKGWSERVLLRVLIDYIHYKALTNDVVKYLNNLK